MAHSDDSRPQPARGIPVVATSNGVEAAGADNVVVARVRRSTTRAPAACLWVGASSFSIRP